MENEEELTNNLHKAITSYTQTVGYVINQVSQRELTELKTKLLENYIKSTNTKFGIYITYKEGLLLRTLITRELYRHEPFNYANLEDMELTQKEIEGLNKAKEKYDKALELQKQEIKDKTIEIGYDRYETPGFVPIPMVY